MVKEDTGMPKKSMFSAQVDLSKFTAADFAPATAEEKAQQEVMGQSSTFLKDGMRRLMKNPLAVASLFTLIVIVAVILIAPLFIPYGYEEIITVGGKRDKGMSNLAPMAYSEKEVAYMEKTGEHLFPHIMGTDKLGRDYFVRVLYGTRVSLSVGCVAAIMVLVIGCIYGSVSGYFGGVVDMVMMRIVDVIYSLPDMLIIILLSVVLKQSLNLDGTFLAALGPNMVSMFIVFGLLYWVGMARLVRGQILTVKQNEYVLAAQCIGTKPSRILRKHVLPNCLSVIIISTALQVPSAIFTESYLSFLGMGVSAPMPSLGSLANTAREGLASYPHLFIFPAVVICLIVLAFNLLGDGLRDAFDPKLQR